MDIYTVLVRLLAESLAIANGSLSNLVNIPANATGALDPNITTTTLGTELVKQITSAAIGAGNMLCGMAEALF